MRVDDTEGFDGTDATGVIRVVVDRSGMVTDVVVKQNWREKVPPTELGAALCTAANKALTNQLVDSVEQDAGPAATVRQDARDALGDPASEVAQALMSEIGDLLAVFGRDLASFRNELSAAAGATTSAPGTRGAIEVTMKHNRVTRVAVHPGWAKSAGSSSVRAEAVSAFTAAARQLENADPRAVTPPASIARLWELARDPDALSRELGLS